ncbi:hypothetical protein LZ31DRAFT_558765 [Colletotrichum somersetense]|nr:hypothetical protein LZ31DRAFT_558765 [Colletotrichum somersetense]
MYVPPSTLPPIPTWSTQPVKTHARRHAHPHALDRRYLDAVVVEPQPAVPETLFLYEQTPVVSSTRSKDTDAASCLSPPAVPITTTTTITTITTLPKNHHLEATTRWRASITRRPHDAPGQLALPTPQPQILSGQRKPW